MHVYTAHIFFTLHRHLHRDGRIKFHPGKTLPNGFASYRIRSENVRERFTCLKNLVQLRRVFQRTSAWLWNTVLLSVIYYWIFALWYSFQKRRKVHKRDIGVYVRCVAWKVSYELRRERHIVARTFLKLVSNYEYYGLVRKWNEIHIRICVD